MKEQIETNMAHCHDMATAIRKDVLYLTRDKKAGFIGSAYSCADILAVLYGSGFIRIEEDIFVLSKGHAASALYSAIVNAGAFPRERLFNEFNTEGFNLGLHTKRDSMPGIVTSGGSLGQGVGLSCGIAMADRINKRDRRVYVLVGDGECNEGSVWEAFMLAAMQKLNKLTIIIDRNRLQSYGHDSDVLNLGDIAEKIRSFNLHTIEIDGHDHKALYNALEEAQAQKEQASVIVANTIKGKGVKEFEDKVIWHYKWPEEEHMASARKELGVE